MESDIGVFVMTTNMLSIHIHNTNNVLLQSNISKTIKETMTLHLIVSDRTVFRPVIRNILSQNRENNYLELA